MPDIIVKRGNKGDLTIKLREPDFDVYRIAIMAYQSNSGKGDKLAAGKVILESCCADDEALKVLADIKKDVKAFASACLDAVDLLEFYDTEVKKN
jgi:hypothetical protein